MLSLLKKIPRTLLANTQLMSFGKRNNKCCCCCAKKNHRKSCSDETSSEYDSCSSSSATSSISSSSGKDFIYQPYVINNDKNRIPFIGEIASPFKATVVKSESVAEETEITFNKTEGYTILFFFPLAFTFVCPTELKEMNKIIPTLENGKHKVYGISVDSQYVLMQWLKTPQNQGGIKGLTLPLISDLNRSISKLYGVLSEAGFAERATLIIDNKGKVRFINVNSSGVGRSTDDLLRIIEALESFDKYGEMCPANWKKGMSKIVPKEAEEMKKFWEEFAKDDKKKN
jgi:peroxiredoxin (alkyl hydroperoxide reductase subunit C)